MEEFQVVEADVVWPLLNNMHCILFNPKGLSHDDARDLQNLLSLLEHRVRKESFLVNAGDVVEQSYEV
jgi:hypothetical protein